MNLPIIAYIGLGSNLDYPLQQLKTARMAIRVVENIKEHAFSSFYSSPAMDASLQPDYINAVMGIITDLSAMTLLRCLQTIEKNQGRVRAERWGARTLDLDLLLYAQQQINLPDLIVPHEGLNQRNFVLYPLQEISPDLTIPSQGVIKNLVALCPPTGLKKL